MSTGFTYKITRSRANTALRSVISSNTNFFRLLQSDGSFYEWDFPVLPPSTIAHYIKLYTRDGFLYQTLEINVNSIEAHRLPVFTDVTLIPPLYGSGDTFTLHRVLNGTWSQIGAGKVSSYAPTNQKTYQLEYKIVSVSGGYDSSLFLIEYKNSIDADSGILLNYSTPKRVILPMEYQRFPRDSVFSIDTTSLKLQRSRHHTFTENFYTEDEALTKERALTGQLLSFFDFIHVPEPRKRELTLATTAATVQVYSELELQVTGYSGQVLFSFQQNQSGGSISATGVYTSGGNTGTDVITITDGSGTELTFSATVQNSYGTVISGEYKWPL